MRHLWLLIVLAAGGVGGAQPAGPAARPTGRGHPPQLTDPVPKPPVGHNGLFGLGRTKFRLSVEYHDREGDPPLELLCLVDGPEPKRSEGDVKGLVTPGEPLGAFVWTSITTFEKPGLYEARFQAKDKDGPAVTPAPIRFRVRSFPVLLAPYAGGVIVLALVGWFVLAPRLRRARRAKAALAPPPAEPAAPLASTPADSGPYRAFISYRRGPGADTARLIQTELKARGIRAFLDVEDLDTGVFDERLLHEIEEAPYFIAVLTPGCLDRCAEPGDWLRREISHALRRRRNIIPLFKDGFRFPPRDSLPPDIADLVRYEGVEYSHTLFRATIARLERFLR